MTTNKKTLEEKKEYARLLFMQGDEQKVIAEKTGVSAVTINRWVREGGWKEHRAAANITRPELVNKLLHTIDRLIEQVMQSDDVDAMAGLGDKLAKLSTTIKRPRYHEMTTEITYDNRYAYQTGDPTLLNEIQRTLSLNLQWQWLAASASFESVENTIFQRGYPYDDDGVAMIQYSNADDDARYFNAYLTASPTFGIWNPRYTAGLRMQHFATTVTDPRDKAGERELALDDPTAFVYANNAFRLKNKWVVDVDYNFTSRGDVLVSSQTRNKHCLSLAVSKTWLANDALHIRLSWYDVLNKTLSRYSTDYGNCLIEQTNNHYRPTIQLLASFRFNTANSKYKGTGAGQDVKSRM